MSSTRKANAIGNAMKNATVQIHAIETLARNLEGYALEHKNKSVIPELML